jgi:hypothetical protein
VYLVGQAVVAAAEERGVGELVSGRGRVGGEDSPDDGERGGVASGARVVGYGRRPRSRRAALGNLAWYWSEEAAVARQACRHSYVLAAAQLDASSFCQIYAEFIHFFESILPDIC